MDTKSLIILAMVMAALGGLLLEFRLNRILDQLKKTNQTLESLLEVAKSDPFDPLALDR
jgi:hypothetical protein